MTEVSGNPVPIERPQTQDHRRKAKPSEVGLARMNAEYGSQGEALLTCSCGAEKFHARRKVAEKWAEDHIAGRHGGRGIWL